MPPGEISASSNFLTKSDSGGSVSEILDAVRAWRLRQAAVCYYSCSRTCVVIIAGSAKPVEYSLACVFLGDELFWSDRSVWRALSP